MRYAAYEELDSSPNIIVDGATGNGTVLTLSHWPKSGTPAHLKRDTSAEIVFAYLDSPASHVQAEIVSNNHFDEDGLVGIYVLLEPSAAEEHRDLLTDVARAGDFGTYRRREAARIAFALSAYADPEASPLPREIFAMPYPQMAAELYRRLLRVLPDLLTGLSDFEPLWGAEDERLALSEESLEKGEITIEERPGLDLAVVRIPENLPAGRIHRFTQIRLAECHPMALHNRTHCSRMLLVRGRGAEFQYRYESWVQLASRRVPLRVDLSSLAEELNEMEGVEGRWVFDGVEQITPRLHREGSPASSIPPEVIQERLECHLSTGPAAWDPTD